MALARYSFSRFQSVLGCPAKAVDSQFLRDFSPNDYPLDLALLDGVAINPFGVGNFTPAQISFLQMDTPLINNTVISQFNAGVTISGDDPRLANSEVIGRSLDNSEASRYDRWE